MPTTSPLDAFTRTMDARTASALVAATRAADTRAPFTTDGEARDFVRAALRLHLVDDGTTHRAILTAVFTSPLFVALEAEILRRALTPLEA